MVVFQDIAYFKPINGISGKDVPVIVNLDVTEKERFYAISAGATADPTNQAGVVCDLALYLYCPLAN